MYFCLQKKEANLEGLIETSESEAEAAGSEARLLEKKEKKKRQ